MRPENMISLLGYLGDNPNFKSPLKESPIVVFSIGQSERAKDSSTGPYRTTHVNWIPVVSFGSLANRVSKSLKKGDLVSIKGSLRTSEYLKDGIKRKGFEVIAESIQQVTLLPANEPDEFEHSGEGVPNAHEA